MGARRNFSLGAKATPPFPISPFPFPSFPFPSPLYVVLPSLPSGHLNPAFGKGYIAKYSENKLPYPFLQRIRGFTAMCYRPINRFFTYLLTYFLSPPFSHFPPYTLPSLPLFPSSPLSFHSLSFLPIWARGFAGAVSKQRKLNYLKLHIQSTNRPRKWFSPVVGDKMNISVIWMK